MCNLILFFNNAVILAETQFRSSSSVNNGQLSKSRRIKTPHLLYIGSYRRFETGTVRFVTIPLVYTEQNS